MIRITTGRQADSAVREKERDRETGAEVDQ